MRRMEWHWQIPIARYGEAWRQGRRLLDRSLRPGAAATYRPMQQARVRVLLTRLLATPDEWQAHIELCEIVSVFMMICLFIIFSDSKESSFWT
jgi:cytochrome P450